MKSITLQNYRCFEKLHLEFSEEINLLIGDNASGKTTIIRAISSVLNSFFVGFSDENTRFLGLTEDDFRREESEFSIINEKYIDILFELMGVEASLSKISKKGRTLLKPLEPIKITGSRIYRNMFHNKEQVIALPLFGNFYTTDIHSTRKISAEPFMQYHHKPSFGYFECLQGDGFLNYWTKRLLVLKEADLGELEISGVLQALINALGPKGCEIIVDVHIRPNKGKVYYYLNDGRIVETAKLSDGYRRLVNIVMDLAFRCMLLNKGIFGLEACAETEGTVLIDEIDLHLHPTLQSVVMKGLRNAFPKLQFIITSHAPMIMTGIPMGERNKIIQLGYNSHDGYTAKEIHTYGLDASTIIEAVLGVTPRSSDVDERLNTLFSLIDSDHYQKASEKLKQMRAEFGERLPELAKAESMLNFLIDDNASNK